MYDSCGNPDFSKPGHPSLAWPADLVTTTGMGSVQMNDLASFVSPVRRLNTSPGDAGYDRRWDIAPGSGGIFTEEINLADLAVLVTVRPPMFERQQAFAGPSCN